MAGLLDYLGANPGLLQQFFPEQNVKRLSADTPLFDITAGQGSQGWNINFGKPGSLTTPALTQSQFDERFGAMQPAAQPPAAPAPQMQPPAQAQQAFDMPTSTYAFGGQMVPTFGQAQPMSDELSARKASAPGPVTPPQEQAPSYQSELLGGSNPNKNPVMEFLDAIRPGFVGRYKSSQAQSETARGMYEVFRSQGMSPNEAAAQAVIAARNPDVLKEKLGRYKNVEEWAANQMGRQGPGGQAQSPMDVLSALERAKQSGKSMGEKEGAAKAEAQIALPGAAADFQQSMQTISELRNHKGRNSIGWHGPTANMPAEWMRGSEAYGAAKLEERLKSRVFGDQVKTMVGMGALSNAEGSKITDAVASLDRGLKKDEYNRTLDFIQETMKNGMDKIATKAGQPAPFGWKGNDGWTSVPMPGSSAPVRIRQVR